MLYLYPTSKAGQARPTPDAVLAKAGIQVLIPAE